MIECPNRLNAVASSVAATSSTYKSEQIEKNVHRPSRELEARPLRILTHTLYMALPRARAKPRVRVCVFDRVFPCTYVGAYAETVQKAQVYMCNMESRKYVRRVQLF